MTDFRERLLRDPSMFVALDERGQMHSFAPVVGADLVERGILWRDHRGHWRVRERDANDILASDPDVAVCDFCRARPVTHTCDADDFTLDDRWGGHHSTGEWAACAACAVLVERRDVEALLIRAVDASTHKPLPPPVLDFLVAFHELFWQHFKGIRRLDDDEHERAR